MRIKLTAVVIPTLPQGNYADVLCPGLNLRIGTKRKTWSVYHRAGGRLRQSKLGYFPSLGLADARKAAGELVERVQAGAPPPPSEPHPSSRLSLDGLIDRYEAHRRRKGGRGTKTLDHGLRVVRNGLKGYLALPPHRSARPTFEPPATPSRPERRLWRTASRHTSLRCFAGPRPRT